MASPGDAGRADQDQVRLARRGDAAAFEQLYRCNVGRVYAVCLRMTGDASLAEELVQEAFFRAWCKIDSFRGDSAFSTWLHRLTVNVVLGHGRTRSRREPGKQVSDTVLASEPQPRSAAPDKSVDLERAIATLPKRARTVFVLHDVEGYKHDEIATMTGMAVGTSKAQLHRARQLLRKALGS